MLFLPKQHYAFIIWLSGQPKTIKPVTATDIRSFLTHSSYFQLLSFSSSCLGLPRGQLLGFILLPFFTPYILFALCSFFTTSIHLTVQIQGFDLPSRTAKRYTCWNLIGLRSYLPHLAQCFFITFQVH